MKNQRVKLLVSLLLALFLATANAEVKLPALFSSNMVMQRNSTVLLYGWANPGERIVITPSWVFGSLFVTADNDGAWQIDVRTTDARTSQNIEFKSRDNEIKIDNILFGEVWLCAGEANMEMPMIGFYNEPVCGAQQALVNSKNTQLRLFTVKPNASKSPLTDLEGHEPWVEASASSVASFSAIAYHFGVQLQKVLDVPVGLISSTYPSSDIRAWMSKEQLSDFETFNVHSLDVTDHAHQSPTVIYNAMVAPLMSYPIQGVIWYQGEANVHEPLVYEQYMPAMVADWANRWAKQLFPFYFTQIAPFAYDEANTEINFPENSAYMRESMEKLVNVIPNSGMATTIDLGSKENIHPSKKKEVADRLLYCALNDTYGMRIFDYEAPRYQSMMVDDSVVYVEFMDADDGLIAYGDIDGFEMAGYDRVFYPAQASVVPETSTIAVSCDSVEAPVAIRYAWRNYATSKIYDTSGLPVASFRTDRWDEATLAK